MSTSNEVAGGKVTGPEFQWLGTAGFRISLEERIILIDPYLSRNERAEPVQHLEPSHVADADMIFLSHGHFDHIADIPRIMEVSKRPGPEIYCPSFTATVLKARGVPPGRIQVLSDGEERDFGSFTLRATQVRHVIYNPRLVLETLARSLGIIRRMLPGIRGRSGPVLVFTLGFGNRTVTQLGTLGHMNRIPSPLQKEDLPATDILLIPLQGRSDICTLGARITANLEPKAVVPQHYDNFFPPVSSTVDIEPFRVQLREMLPECVYFRPALNEKFSLDDVMEGRSRQ